MSLNERRLVRAGSGAGAFDGDSPMSMARVKNKELAVRKLLLVSFAALGIVPAGTWAQASSVVISGIIDGGVRVDSGTVSGSVKSVGSGLQTASRLNFSGVEDIGAGLKAAFVLEMGLAIDTGAGVANPPGTANGPASFGRTAAVAVGGDDMGYVSMGRQYTPLWAVSAGPMNDPFGANWFGGIGTIYSTANAIRASNSIVYSYGYTARTMLLPAPRNGLGVAAMWALSEASDPAPKRSGEQLGFNISYGDGTWWAGYGYHQIKGSNTAISPTAAVTDQPGLKQQTLAASYQFSFARLHVGLNRGQNGSPAVGKVDRSNWHVGATIPLPGNQSLRLLYGRADDRTPVNADFNSFQLGYQYDLSKRTNLYAGFGQVDNSAAALATLVGTVGTYARGSTPRSVIAGVRHNF